MKNKLIDLNNHLFAQLERLGDEGLSEEDMATEISRSKAITSVAKEIVSNGRLALDVGKAVADGELHGKPIPKMLENG